MRVAVKTGFKAPHLAGQTIVALCDGRVEKDIAVDGSGNFSLKREAGYVTAGLPIQWQLKPMRFIAQLRDGSSNDRTKQIPYCWIRVKDTRSLYAAPNEFIAPYEVNLEAEPDNSGALPLVTDELRCNLKLNPKTREGTVCFSSDDPCPCTVLDAIPRVNYGEA